MNSDSPQEKNTQKNAATADNQKPFQNVFHKYSAFTDWADSSSEDDVNEGEEMEICASVQPKEANECDKPTSVPLPTNEAYEVDGYDECWSENDHPFEDFTKQKCDNGREKCPKN